MLRVVKTLGLLRPEPVIFVKNGVITPIKWSKEHFPHLQFDSRFNGRGV